MADMEGKGQTMREGIAACVALTCLLGLMVFLTGSCIYVSGRDIHVAGCRPSSYERTTIVRQPLAAGSTLDVETVYGSIAATGADVPDCEIVATITGHAK